jgi:hypothetical protein
MKGELQEMMKSIGVGSEEEIDKIIADIKWKLHTDSHPLKGKMNFERYIAVAALAGADVSMSALSRCLLPCPRKDDKYEFPFERYIAVAALTGEDVSMSAMSRCLLPLPAQGRQARVSVREVHRSGGACGRG